jgi:hypothetical protein
MDAPRRARNILRRMTMAVRKVAGKFRARPQPRVWPNLTPPESVPADAAAHAVDFANRWVDRLENFVESRMHALEIPEHQIGSSDHRHGVPWRTFFPHEGSGGGVSPGGRINVDSGVLNPDLMKHLGSQASGAYTKARLRDRIDSSIVHEFEEARWGSHDEAAIRAPDTELPVRRQVHELLKAIAEAEKGRVR